MRQISALLILSAGTALSQSYSYAQVPTNAATPAQSAPLAGQNTVSGLSVRQAASGAWTADFDYYYTGSPRFAALRIDLVPQSAAFNNPVESERWTTFLPSPQPGSHHVSATIAYPRGQGISREVVVKLLRELVGDQVIASQQIDKIIDWPDFQTWIRDQQVAQNSPEINLKHAIAMIDSEDDPQLHQAKSIIEKLISQNPRLDAGYVELARIAMKTNGGRKVCIKPRRYCPPRCRSNLTAPMPKSCLVTCMHISTDSTRQRNCSQMSPGQTRPTSGFGPIGESRSRCRARSIKRSPSIEKQLPGP